MSPLGWYVVQTLLTLAGIAALAYGVVYLARRSGVAGRSGPLELVARLPIDGRKSIYLVRIGARVLVVGAADSSVQLLSELDASEIGALGLGRVEPDPALSPPRT